MEKGGGAYDCVAPVTKHQNQRKERKNNDSNRLFIPGAYRKNEAG